MIDSPSTTANFSIAFTPYTVTGGMQPAPAPLALYDEFSIRVRLRANATHHQGRTRGTL